MPFILKRMHAHIRIHARCMVLHTTNTNLNLVSDEILSHFILLVLVACCCCHLRRLYRIRFGIYTSRFVYTIRFLFLVFLVRFLSLTLKYRVVLRCVSIPINIIQVYNSIQYLFGTIQTKRKK